MRGYITKHRNGYRVEIHLGYDDNGKRLRYRKTISNKRAAEKHLRDKLDELETEGSIRARSTETFEAYLKRWLEAAARPRVRQRTFDGYRSDLERHIFGTQLGKKPLVTVTPADIQECYAAIQLRIQASGKGTGATTIKNLHAAVRSALNQAVKWRVITQNPALFVDRPRVRRKEKVVLRTSDFPAFMEAALEEERLGVMWVCALASGARPEEYLAWKWSDVSWRTCEIAIVRALVRPQRKLEPDQPNWRFEPVKTNQGRRTISLDEQVMFLLRRHQAQQADEKEAAADTYEDHGLVFCTELGRPLRQRNLASRDFKRIIKRAGLDPALSPYSLRHSCATGLIELGEDIGQVSSMLGHASKAFTYDTYVARRPLKAAAAKMGGALFGQVGGL